ncbi:hypothetical protein M9H77_21977 [Catharanthus roseus]|uniref:Uncharacterized protein n=1 Tax=Catharanthus roseus TaxID=4058 RepID=A0ACC0AR71_CATRO|nr:hypothetical protein M9H77_00212 [Catharanthus roseus]KAI5662654.1 hypothetical protein M9H77_21977 [Catharanthus roseus]
MSGYPVQSPRDLELDIKGDTMKNLGNLGGWFVGGIIVSNYHAKIGLEVVDIFEPFEPSKEKRPYAGERYKRLQFWANVSRSVVRLCNSTILDLVIYITAQIGFPRR